MTPSVFLPGTIYQEIIQHSREGKPEEICGILRGQRNHAFELIRARNIASERVDNYTVDPTTLLLQFSFEEAGDEMMGIYHSHPTSPAYPSATDAWNAGYPDSYYFICSLENEDAPDLRCFGMVWQFIEPDWQAIRRSLEFYETRPGLFAHFVAQEAPLPAVLEKDCATLTRPFYLVYYVPDHDESQFEGRIVTVTEFSVESRDPA